MTNQNVQTIFVLFGKEEISPNKLFLVKACQNLVFAREKFIFLEQKDRQATFV